MQPHQQWHSGYYQQPQQPGSWPQQQYAQPQQQWQQTAAWPQQQPAGVWPQQQPAQAWGPPATAQVAQYHQQMTVQQPGQYAPHAVSASAGEPPLPPEPPGPQFLGQPAQPPTAAPAATDITARTLSQDQVPPLPQEAAPPLPEEAAPPLPPGPPLPPQAAAPAQAVQQAQQTAYQQQQQLQQPLQQAGQSAYPQQLQQPPHPGQHVQGQQAPHPQQAAYTPAQQPQFAGYLAQPQHYAAAPAQYQQPQQYTAGSGYQQPQPAAYAGGWGYPSQAQQPYAAVQPSYPPHAGYPPQHPAAPPAPHLQHPTAAYPQQAAYVQPGAPAAGPPPMQAPSPAEPVAAQPLPQATVDALGLLAPGPARTARPRKLAVLLRGLPGSGKSHVARLMREREAAAGGDPPRIMSLDDYFMTVRAPPLGARSTAPLHAPRTARQLCSLDTLASLPPGLEVCAGCSQSYEGCTHHAPRNAAEARRLCSAADAGASARPGAANALQEVEKEVEDEEGARRGRKRKAEVLEYRYEREMEGEGGRPAPTSAAPLPAWSGICPVAGLEQSRHRVSAGSRCLLPALCVHCLLSSTARLPARPPARLQPPTCAACLRPFSGQWRRAATSLSSWMRPPSGCAACCPSSVPA